MTDSNERPELIVFSGLGDDQSVRDSVADLLASAGFAVQTFGSAAEFIRANHPGSSHITGRGGLLRCVPGLRRRADSSALHPPDTDFLRSPDSGGKVVGLACST
jgi:hypothetical protein